MAEVAEYLGYGMVSIDLSPPPPVEDPDRFYRSGENVDE